MIDDAALLRRYAGQNDEEAFADFVRRHVDLVYGVALRKVGGDTHLAEDAVQQVFTDAARKAAALSQHPVVTGWLFTSAHYAALQLVRAERRRRMREEKAQAMNEFERPGNREIDWEQLRPLLDDLVRELPDGDRDAILLRYFEGKPLADVAARLQLSEEGARSRVDRAVDKLHGALARKGVTSTAAALVAALGNQSTVAAPSGLAAAVSAAAVAAVAKGTAVGTVATVTVAAGASKLILFGTAAMLVAAFGLALSEARVAKAARQDLDAAAREQAALEGRLHRVEQAQAAAEERARGADADAARLLQAIQAASPLAALPADGECMAFVIDTSGSMRNPRNGKLWSAALAAVGEALLEFPTTQYLIGYDADGRLLFSHQGGWLGRSAEAMQAIEQAMAGYEQDTISSPVPGIYRAMREAPPPGKSGTRLHICVIGDEFVEPEEPVLRRLQELNAPDASGHRRATISATQLPTTIRFTGGPMGNTGLKFKALMTEVARQHGGTYRLLPDDVLERGPKP